MNATRQLVADCFAAGLTVLTRAEGEAIAAQYGVSSRIVRRWLRNGVNVRSPRSVAAYLAESRRPSTAAIAAILKISNP
jgi:hypothetical protein